MKRFHWVVRATSYDSYGPGPLISTHQTKSDAIQECVERNNTHDCENGMYMHYLEEDDANA